MIRRFTVSFGLLCLLSACANSSAEECDATDAGSVFSASACLRGGGFEARLQQIKQDTHRKVEDTRLSQQRTDELEARAVELAEDQTALERQLNETESELAVLRLRLNSVRAKNAEDQARLDALEEQLTATEQRLAAARRSPPEGAAEIAELEEEIARKQQAIKSLIESIERG